MKKGKEHGFMPAGQITQAVALRIPLLQMRKRKKTCPEERTRGTVDCLKSDEVEYGIMAEKELKTLHQILSSEQQLLQRTDQKAYTLLSIIGVFMVFFIVHFTKVPGYLSVITMTFFYLLSALISIGYLMMVISPRIRNTHVEAGEGKAVVNPTFFAGIVHHKSVEEFSEAIRRVSANEEELFAMFASSLYSIAHINAHKSKYLRRAIISFIITIIVELSIIFILYVHLYRENVLPLGM